MINLIPKQCPICKDKLKITSNYSNTYVFHKNENHYYKVILDYPSYEGFVIPGIIRIVNNIDNTCSISTGSFTIKLNKAQIFSKEFVEECLILS